MVDDYIPEQYSEDLTFVSGDLPEEQQYCAAPPVETESEPFFSGQATSSLVTSPLVGVHASPLCSHLAFSPSKHLVQILIDSLTKYGSHAFNIQLPKPGIMRRIGERLHASLSGRLFRDSLDRSTKQQSNQFLFVLLLPASIDRRLLPDSSYLAVMSCSEGLVGEVARIVVPSLSEFTYISLVKDLERALIRTLSDNLALPVSVFVSSGLIPEQHRFSVELFHVVTLPIPKYVTVLSRLSTSEYDKLLLWCSSPQDHILSGHPLVAPLRNRAEYFLRKYNQRYDSQALAMLELCCALATNLSGNGSTRLL